ncbi:MAG: hypothetical protein EXR82_03415 [Gammaproteobacteria bacterium]|nr:hypothetical protein [Gammaproteobacteria bacterium]
MPRHRIYAIVFIEGFCSLGAEIIALRRLVPHIGSSIAERLARTKPPASLPTSPPSACRARLRRWA